MRYADSGYAIVLGTLFLYALSLVWRRRRLTRTAERISTASARTDEP